MHPPTCIPLTTQLLSLLSASSSSSPLRFRSALWFFNPFLLLLRLLLFLLLLLVLLLPPPSPPLPPPQKRRYRKSLRQNRREGRREIAFRQKLAGLVQREERKIPFDPSSSNIIFATSAGLSLPSPQVLTCEFYYSFLMSASTTKISTAFRIS